MLAGGELQPDEAQGIQDKQNKNKLLLAAIRLAALDVGHCSDVPDTDFGPIGGKAERLPPSLLNPNLKRWVAIRCEH